MVEFKLYLNYIDSPDAEDKRSGGLSGSGSRLSGEGGVMRGTYQWRILDQDKAPQYQITFSPTRVRMVKAPGIVVLDTELVEELGGIDHPLDAALIDASRGDAGWLKFSLFGHQHDNWELTTQLDHKLDSYSLAKVTDGWHIRRNHSGKNHHQVHQQHQPPPPVAKFLNRPGHTKIGSLRINLANLVDPNHPPFDSDRCSSSSNNSNHKEGDDSKLLPVTTPHVQCLLLSLCHAITTANARFISLTNCLPSTEYDSLDKYGDLLNYLHPHTPKGLTSALNPMSRLNLLAAGKASQ